MPFVLTHWINLLAMFFLALSGFYIHYPIVPGLMGLARGTHFFWMFVLLINLIVRLVMMFFVKDAIMPDTREVDKDFKNWLPQEANRHQMLPWIKYYLFLKKDHPISAKYGVLQKIAYIATPFLILAAAYTGFCLWGPTSGWPFFYAGTAWVASLFNLGGGADPMGDPHPALLDHVGHPDLHRGPRVPREHLQLRPFEDDLRLERGCRRGQLTASTCRRCASTPDVGWRAPGNRGPLLSWAVPFAGMPALWIVRQETLGRTSNTGISHAPGPAASS